MSGPPNRDNGQRLFWLVSTLAALLTVWAYLPGLGGQFLFDDYPNLAGLDAIRSEPTAYNVVQYVFSGTSSELGRPLSLLSFAAQTTSWDQRPQDFIAFNIGLHLLNGLLWYALLAALQRCGRLPRHRAFPLAGAALWVFLPIHAGIVLYVVQRMAILATTCFLAGSMLYVRGRLRASEDPIGGYLRMATGVFIGTVVGTLCKETAALTPLMLLLLEGTLLIDVPRPAGWRRASALLLWFPSLLLMAYLAVDFPHFLAGYGGRTFTMSERLLTETRVMFIYLADAFFASKGSVRILYDDLPLSTSLWNPWTTVVATAAWAALVFGAFRWRKRYPVFALAIGWYLIGNLLESSFIPLEIAFSHRSYLPLLGPALGLTAIAWNVAAAPAAQRLRGILFAGGAAYLLLLFLGTWSAATLWGEPIAQARNWVRLQPDSPRATLTYGNLLLRHKDFDTTYRLYADAFARHPQDAVFALSLFELGCFTPEIHLPLDTIRNVLDHYRGPETVIVVGTILSMVSRLEAGHCPYQPAPDVLALANTMLDNEAFAPKRLNLYHASAMLLDLMGNKRAALDRLEKAIAMDPQVPLLQQAVLWSVQLGDTARAHKHLQTLEDPARTGWKRHWLFRREIAGTRQLVSLSESLPTR